MIATVIVGVVLTVGIAIVVVIIARDQDRDRETGTVIQRAERRGNPRLFNYFATYGTLISDCGCISQIIDDFVDLFCRGVSSMMILGIMWNETLLLGGRGSEIESYSCHWDGTVVQKTAPY